jgi:hypothetical protein
MGRAGRRATLVGVLVGGLLGGLGPGTAAAARYHVYSCHTPNGDVAPIDGWTGSESDPYTHALDDCGGTTTYGLTAALDGTVGHATNTSHAVWSFATAPNLSLAGSTLYRHEAVPGGVGPNAAYATVLSTFDLTAGTVAEIDSCQANVGCGGLGTNDGGFDPSNRVVTGAAGPGSALLLFEAFCLGADGATCPPSAGYAAEVDLYAADLTLEDDVGPAVANVSGALVGGGTLTGTADIRFAATDDGSGVYSSQLTVDGKPVAGGVVDANGGHCQTVGQAGGTRDFLYQQPCLSSTHADVALDTSALADGSHAVAVTVDDAAGNASPVYSGTITTRNAPQGGVAQVTGVIAQGQRLIANPGTWNPVATGYTYQWLRCGSGPGSCQAISGATGQVYVPVAADDYQQLAVDVTAHDPAGSTQVRSALAGPVADPNGNAAGGGTVTAQSGGLTGAGGGTAGAGAGAGHVANGTGGCASPHLSALFGASAAGRVRLGAGATLRGKLACGGTPVGGAAIDASVARRGEAGPPGTTVLRSAADGSFALALGPGPSREVTLTYRSFADAAAPSATAVATLEVTPSIGLTIRPARVRNGQTITYTGQVFGGYIPAGGLRLEVQYRDGRTWRTFDQVRARQKDGRYVYRYTFRRTTIPIVYTFRVVIPPGGISGYPYAATASRPRSVKVNP